VTTLIVKLMSVCWTCLGSLGSATVSFFVALPKESSQVQPTAAFAALGIFGPILMALKVLDCRQIKLLIFPGKSSVI